VNVMSSHLVLAVLTGLNLLLVGFLFAKQGVTVLCVFLAWSVLYNGLGPLSLVTGIDSIYVSADAGRLITEYIQYPTFMLSIGCLVAAVSLKFQTQPCVQVPTEKYAGASMRRFGLCLSIISVFIGAAVIVTSRLDSAPLFMVGGADAHELDVARDELYSGSAAEALAIPRYLLLYLLGPAMFLLWALLGVGSRLVCAFVFFIGLLSLAKTASVMMMFCLFIGYLCANRRTFAVLALGLTVCVFIALVQMKYNFERGLGDVLYVLWGRSVTAPTALTYIYMDTYHYAEGLRSSVWYVRIFGGEFFDHSRHAYQLVFPYEQHIDGCAPAGLPGALQPNVPTWLHFPAIVVLYSAIYVFSGIARKLPNPWSVLAAGILGIQSVFFFLTDPLTVLNSYGVLWLMLAIALGAMATGQLSLDPAGAREANKCT